MSHSNTQVFENLDDLSVAAARRFEMLARQKVSLGQTFSLALSGGSTPRRLYQMLADPALCIAWDRVHLFQVDERCVPPDDPESNYRMIRDALLGRVPIPKDNFHRIAAEREDRDEAARDYAAELARILQPKAGEWPRFDLIFLGMGADGHTASLFPSSAALQERKLWVRANYSERLGKHRITLTFPVLNAASEIIFLVSGEDKAETLWQVLEGRPGIFPAQGVKPQNGLLSWFVDKGSARLLAPSTDGQGALLD